MNNNIKKFLFFSAVPIDVLNESFFVSAPKLSEKATIDGDPKETYLGGVGGFSRKNKKTGAIITVDMMASTRSNEKKSL